MKPISVPRKCFGQVGLDLIGPLCKSNQKNTLYHALIISPNMLRLKL